MISFPKCSSPHVPQTQSSNVMGSVFEQWNELWGPPPQREGLYGWGTTLGEARKQPSRCTSAPCSKPCPPCLHSNHPPAQPINPLSKSSSRDVTCASNGAVGKHWLGRGRVPERTGKRSRCCGFAEVLGFFRADLEGTNIRFRDFKMTTWSFQTSLTKWDPLTRPGWWDIEWNISKTAGFRQKAVFRACFVRSVKSHWMWCFYSIQLIFSGST